ncbi:hypothetical protein ADT36_21260, partial [Yersinia pestis subsp. microtus bv. Caucasica]
LSLGDALAGLLKSLVFLIPMLVVAVVIRSRYHMINTYLDRIKARGCREKIILASKVSGPSRGDDQPIRPNMALD